MITIRQYGSNAPLFIIGDDNVVRHYSGNAPAFTIGGDIIRKYAGNAPVYTVSGDTIREYAGNAPVYTISENVVRDYVGNAPLYIIDTASGGTDVGAHSGGGTGSVSQGSVSSGSYGNTNTFQQWEDKMEAARQRGARQGQMTRAMLDRTAAKLKERYNREVDDNEAEQILWYNRAVDWVREGIAYSKKKNSWLIGMENPWSASEDELIKELERHDSRMRERVIQKKEDKAKIMRSYFIAALFGLGVIITGFITKHWFLGMVTGASVFFAVLFLLTLSEDGVRKFFGVFFDLVWLVIVIGLFAMGIAEGWFAKTAGIVIIAASVVMIFPVLLIGEPIFTEVRIASDDPISSLTGEDMKKYKAEVEKIDPYRIIKERLD